jgi:hypothetical protein
MATLDKEYKRAYYAKNKDRIKNQIREHYLQNKPAARARYRKYAATLKGRYAIYRAGAKKRSILFELSIEEFKQLIQGACVYCGGPGYGVDREDSAKAYVLGNVVPCCSDCNWMKQSLDKNEFIRRCILIADKHRSVS